jgi:MFS family permease
MARALAGAAIIHPGRPQPHPPPAIFCHASQAHAVEQGKKHDPARDARPRRQGEVMTGLFMSRSAAVRYASGAGLYFAQGIPKGLLHIAMPAWLASQGVSASAIASYLAIIVLPWAFKLVTGPLMERFAFRPMGNRRPWVLAAQLGLVVSLLGLGFVHDPVAQIGLLTVLGVVINSFAATQDVAVTAWRSTWCPRPSTAASMHS